MAEYELVVAVGDWVPPAAVGELVKKALEEVEIYVVEIEER